LNQEPYKLKVVQLESSEIEIIGNRIGSRDLADVCRGLSELSDEEVQTAANHYHAPRRWACARSSHYRVARSFEQQAGTEKLSRFDQLDGTHCCNGNLIVASHV